MHRIYSIRKVVKSEIMNSSFVLVDDLKIEHFDPVLGCLKCLAVGDEVQFSNTC